MHAKNEARRDGARRDAKSPEAIGHMDGTVGEAVGTARAAQAENRGGTEEAPLFACDYEVDLDVLERYARLNMLKRQRATAAFVAIAAFFTALLVLTTDAALWPVALACAVLGAILVAWHQRSPSAAARRLLDGLSAGQAHRTVRFFEDRAELATADGSVRSYPVSGLAELRLNDDMAVFVFGAHGITVPRESMVKGTWEELLVWGRDHISKQDIGRDGSHPDAVNGD